jgi:plastocyanin
MLRRIQLKCSAGTVALVAIVGCSGAAPPATPAAQQTGPQPQSGMSVVTGRAPAGAFIALEPLGEEPPLPSGPVVMDQYSRMFIPEILFVRVGQVVEFRNSEDVDHNIRVLRNPTGTTIMDVSGSQNHVFRHTFERPGTFDVSCDLHPGMRATIVASRTPYVVMADVRGNFTLTDVPDGMYTLRISTPGRDSTQEVAVAGPRTEVTAAAR